MKLSGGLIVSLLLCSSAGCSPYPYKKQSSGLAKSFVDIRNSYAQGRLRLSADSNAARKLEWMLQRPMLESVNCGVDLNYSGSCSMGRRDTPLPDTSVITGGVPASVETSPVSSAVPAASAISTNSIAQQEDACAVVQAPGREVSLPMMDRVRGAGPLTRESVFKGIEEYLDGLVTITKAEDRAAFDVAAGEASAGLGSLVGSAAAFTGNPAALAVGPLVKASSNASLWLVGTALDHRRHETLRDALVRGCQPFRILSRVIGLIFEEQKGMRLRTLGDKLSNQIQRANTHRDKRVITDDQYGAMIDCKRCFDALL